MSTSADTAAERSAVLREIPRVVGDPEDVLILDARHRYDERELIGLVAASVSVFEAQLLPLRQTDVRRYVASACQRGNVCSLGYVPELVGWTASSLRAN